MKRSIPALLAAALLAFAAPPTGAQGAQRSPDMRLVDLSARGDVVVATTQTSRRSYALVRMTPSGHERLRIPTSRDPYVGDVGTDRGGRPVVVYSRADRRGDRDLFLYDLAARQERRLAASARGTDEHLPAMWGGELVFERSGAPRGHNGVYRMKPGGRPRLVHRVASVAQTDIERGIVMWESDVPSGIQGEDNAFWVLRRGARTPRVAARSYSSEDGSDQTLAAPSLDGGFLHYVSFDSRAAGGGSGYEWVRQRVDGGPRAIQRAPGHPDAYALAVADDGLYHLREGEKGVFHEAPPAW